MKKLLAILLGILLILSLCACGNEAEDDIEPDDGSAGQSTIINKNDDAVVARPGGVGKEEIINELTEEECIEKALEHAGCKKSVVVGLEAEIDIEKFVREIEFKDGDYEYEYEVNFKTHEVTQTAKYSLTQPFTMDEAINKALKEEGFARTMVQKLDADIEQEDGCTCWEVEFTVGKSDYAYKYDVTNGDFLGSSKTTTLD